MTARVVGYHVILPRPWVRLPVTEGAEEQVRALVTRRTSQWDGAMPPDQVGPLRRSLERRLLSQVQDARKVGGVDVYFPESDVNGLLVGASFVVSEVAPPGPSGDTDEVELVRRRLLAEGAVPVEVDGTTWARSERVVQPPPDDPELDVPSRRITYLAPRPDTGDRWLLVGFSCVGDGDPESANTAVVVELFDAMMSTWVWQWEGDELPEPVVGAS